MTARLALITDAVEEILNHPVVEAYGALIDFEALSPHTRSGLSASFCNSHYSSLRTEHSNPNFILMTLNYTVAAHVEREFAFPVRRSSV